MFICVYLIYQNETKMETQEFTYRLVKKTTYMGVTFLLYSSTYGWFVETSQGLITEYMRTKKEALNYMKTAKNILRIESK